MPRTTTSVTRDPTDCGWADEHPHLRGLSSGILRLGPDLRPQLFRAGDRWCLAIPEIVTDKHGPLVRHHLRSTTSIGGDLGAAKAWAEAKIKDQDDVRDTTPGNEASPVLLSTP